MGLWNGSPSLWEGHVGARGRNGHEGVPLIVVQRQLGHSNLDMTSVYLQGIDNAEIIQAVHARSAPMVRVATSLKT